MNPFKVLAVGFGLVAIAFALAAIDACNPDSWDRAAPVVPTSDNPCGARWIYCPTDKGCCMEGIQTCGGEPASVGCPAGMCCDIDNGMTGGARDAGARVNPQRVP